MENEGGAQIAYFSNPYPPGGFSSGSSRNLQARNAGWSMNSWDWDGVMFVAKPVEENCHGKGISSIQNVGNPSRNLLEGANTRPENNKRKSSSDVEDAGNLTLKLGGSSYGDDINYKNSKRYRSGSTVTSYPACQVDNCQTDLTGAKDYHRRHKVCESHSKASKALVGNIMQRFCQQCSRFHPLEEFDEGKRSCRRRLAGHNKRRRKTQQEESGCKGFLSGDVNGALRNLDIVGLVAVLSQQLQANESMDKLVGRMVSNQDYLVQCLSKLKPMSGTSEDLSSNKAQTHQAIDLNIPQDTQAEAQAPRVDTKALVLQTNGIQPPVPNLETVRILTTLIQRSPEALNLLNRAVVGQQTPTFQSHDDRARINNHVPCMKPTNFASGCANGLVGSVINNKVAEHSISQGGSTFPLHGFDSSQDTHRSCQVTLKQCFTDKNLAKERLSSRSPSSSPPVVQNLFPLHSGDESKETDSVSAGEETDLTPEQSPSVDGLCKITLPNGESSDKHPFPSSSVHVGSDLRISGYTSSGSDQSPSSSNSDTQERTSRIIFKLFGKDPSDFPFRLRAQILEWLSHSPSDMESYIRPGCVLLTVFASMPSAAWDQLRVDLQERLMLLLSKDCGYDFWKHGRIMVQAEQQLASFKDGEIEFCRPCRSSSAPKIISVRPIAVVAGEEATLILRGQNLMAPGTKILCAYRGKYISKNVIPDDHQVCAGTLCTKSVTIEHKFPGGPADVLGRCFIEVERGLKGNSFPVIVADRAICRELRSLEGLFEDEVIDRHPKMHSQADVQLSTQENVVNFLNELGWLFQRNSYSGKEPLSPLVLLARFKFLLTYAVERDWNYLLKKILDILFGMYTEIESIKEALHVVSEIHLLHRAVKRNCGRVVDSLLYYMPLSGANGNFIFSPDMIGPGGLTPLHLAASMENAEDVVDTLTSDPRMIGLQAWTTALDANQQTPHAYALMRNNHSYNRLVARKLTNSLSAQISISIVKEASINETAIQGASGTQCVDATMLPLSVAKLPQNCAECARLGTKRVSRPNRYHGARYRPFVYSLVAVAAVCVCVCLLFKGPPTICSVAPFKWENIDYGTH